MHPKAELERFRSEKNAYEEFRARVETSIHQAQLALFTGTEAQKEFHCSIYSYMTDKLETRPDILETLLPDFPVGCRRLTPGPGYLDACMAENVEYIGMPIKRVCQTGIETADGKLREVDMIICATGYDVYVAHYHFGQIADYGIHSSRQNEPPFTGQDGVTLDEVWDPIPEAYLSICPPRMPNLFMFHGPNGGPGTGGTIFMLENVCDYAIQCILKLQNEYIKSMVVRSVQYLLTPLSHPSSPAGTQVYILTSRTERRK